MRYTILRPTYFMEMWLSPALGFDHRGHRVTLYGSGERPISFISLADVAEFAVRALHDPEAIGATLELGGPEAVSPLEVVDIFEDVAGARFDVQHVPESALRAQRADASDPLQQAFSALMLAYAHGDAIEMAETQRRYPFALTTVREYARRVVGA